MSNQAQYEYRIGHSQPNSGIPDRSLELHHNISNHHTGAKDASLSVVHPPVAIGDLLGYSAGVYQFQSEAIKAPSKYLGDILYGNYRLYRQQ